MATSLRRFRKRTGSSDRTFSLSAFGAFFCFFAAIRALFERRQASAKAPCRRAGARNPFACAWDICIVPASLSSTKDPQQDEIMTSPGEATYPDPLEEAHITATHTLVVENRTTLKLRKCRLSVTNGPDSGKEIISDKERIR